MASYTPLAHLPPYPEPSHGSQDRSEPENHSTPPESLIEPSPPTPLSPEPEPEPAESTETINQPESTHNLIGSWWLELSSLTICLTSFAAIAKWNWTTRYSEPLITFERFDAASRGAWGSLRLIGTFLQHPHWASLGALTTIILLAFEPLIQIILTFEDQPVTVNGTEHAQVPSIDGTQATEATAFIGRSSLLDAGIWTILEGSCAMGFIPFPGPDGKESKYPFGCGSSNVRPDMGIAAAIWNGFSPLITKQNLWPTFTWGYFDDPPDVSNNSPDANLEMSDQTLSITKYTIPEVSLQLSNYNGKSRCASETDLCPDTYLSAKFTTNPGHTISFRELNTLILATQFLQANESWHDNETTWEDTAVTAQECSLFFCINEYETIIEKSILRERVSSSWNIRTPASYDSTIKEVGEFMAYANYTLDMNGAWPELTDLQISIPNQDYSSRAGNLSQQSFNITQASIMSLLKTLKDGFGLADCTSNCTTNTTIYPALGSSQPSSLMSGLGETNNVSLTFETVALSLTKWMRDREFSTTSVVHGDATMFVVITRVKWIFLVFPAVTLILGIVFAALSIRETHRLKRGAWKDSALVTLACAPTGEFRDRLQAAVATGKIFEVGRMAEVMMEYRDGLGNLVLKKEEDQPRV
ncbi:hypothetical protein G7Z17_g3074 [Cylindrodendrum hubeiense]|uniref:Uncharacterized protein n=1 Tax=Cylindrodendrum hubeiense TaxID=595255 RepID=A0A9P5LJQ5_9HYPO|nr:hypothetical protein G7Z17_g3074 [Cylindrodendrum hubeiense]